MGFIGNWQSGATPSRRHPEYYDGNIPWLKTGDLNDSYINDASEYITDEGMNNSSVYLNPIGSVLIAMYGATIGKLGIANIAITTNQACCACLPICVENRFLFYFLMYRKNYFIMQSVGGAQPNISKEKIVSTLFPIPPLNQQRIIVSKIEKFFSLINDIEINKKSLSEIIVEAKSKILNIAIRGKLVPQDPNDEPASVLLEHIRTEKEELIKQGKIKRDKKESIIFKGDDNSYYEKFANETIHCIDKEIPFDIPDSWSFEKIRNIFIVNPKNNLVDDTTVSFIPMNMIDEQFSGKYQYEIKNWSVCKNGFTHFASNDVAFAKISPCFENRKSVLFEKLENDVGAGTTELYVIRRYINNILGKYILYFVKSEYFILRGKNTFSGVVGQQRVDKDVMLDTYFPIPPLNEQKKIVKKVELLMELLNSMETSLS